MFNVIIIVHRGSAPFPRFFTFEYEADTIYAQLLNRPSVLGLEPFAYSVIAKGRAIFCTAPVEYVYDEEDMSFALYKQRLAEYFANRMEEGKESDCSAMALIRRYFYLNRTEAALPLVEKMPRCADMEMLLYILKHRRKELDFESRYYISNNLILSARKCVETKAMVTRTNEVCGICAGLDAQSGIIFAMEVLEQICPRRLFSLFALLKISNNYSQIYFLMKIAERFLKCGYRGSAALALVSAACKIKTGQDMLLRNELICRAMSLSHSENWRTVLYSMVDNIRAMEKSQYGEVLFSFPKLPAVTLDPSQITVSNGGRIYEFNVFKKHRSDLCAGHLYITNPGMVKINALILGSNEFVPVYDSRKAIRVNVSRIAAIEEHEQNKVCIKGIEPGADLWITGVMIESERQIPCNTKLSLINRETNIILEDIEYTETATVVRFVVEGPLRSIMVYSEFGDLHIAGSLVIVSLGLEVRCFDLETEIAPGIFEKVTHYV